MALYAKMGFRTVGVYKEQGTCTLVTLPSECRPFLLQYRLRVIPT